MDFLETMAIEETERIGNQKVLIKDVPCELQAPEDFLK